MFKLFINGIQIGNYESLNGIIQYVYDYGRVHNGTKKEIDIHSVKFNGKTCHISTVDRYL